MAAEGGAFDAPPMPVSGLGNFKGVMLCNRPSDEPSRFHGGDDGVGAFKSMISATQGEQLGLTPFKTFQPTVKTRGPSAALRRHVQWLKELQEQMRGERDQFEEEERVDEERKVKMKANLAKHREAVREMLAERDGKPLASASMKDDTSKKKPPPAAKPLWAMTEKEKDTFEEEEADELINFAENLDFDRFVGDLEFRQGLEAMRDRTGKLQKEQDAFKDALVRDFNAKADDDEGKSTSVGSPRNLLEDGIEGASALGDVPRSEYSEGTASRMSRERYGKAEWDSSTACGDERPAVDRDLKAAADAILESHPQIRAVHSKESVQRLIEKARTQIPATLEECMRQDGPLQAPVIVTSEDTQARLHKPVDPSLLPYLYRSPAI